MSSPGKMDNVNTLAEPEDSKYEVYTAEELEAKSIDGLLAILEDYKTVPRDWDGADRCYIDACKPIRQALRAKNKRKREEELTNAAGNVAHQADATAAPASVPIPEVPSAPDSVEPDVDRLEPATSSAFPKFGKAKDITHAPSKKLTGEDFADLLTKEMTKATCSKPRSSGVFEKKKKAFSSQVSETTPRKVKPAGTRVDDVAFPTLVKRPGEFPDQSLQVRGKALFCQACVQEIGSGSGDIRSHLKTAKHTKAMEAFNSQAQKKDDTAKFLEADRLRRLQSAQQSTLTSSSSSSSSSPSSSSSSAAEVVDCSLLCEVGVKGMEKVPMATQVHRFKVLQAVLLAGIPPEKLGKPNLRELLEGGVARLSSSSHMIETYLPSVITRETDTVKSELGNRNVGIYTDGTTQEGEAFAIVARFVDDKMKVQTRVIKVTWYEFSLDNENISAAVVAALFAFGIDPAVVLAFMSDRCSVNGRSFRSTLSSVYVGSDMSECMPHTYNHVGEHLLTPFMDSFLALYNIENGKSNRFRTEFRKRIGTKPPKTSGTRWYGDLGAVIALRPNFTNGVLLEIANFLVENKYCIKTAAKMKTQLENPRTSTILQLEATVMEAVGQQIKITGRLLEQDGYTEVLGYKYLRRSQEVLAQPLNADLLAELILVAAAAPALPPPPLSPLPVPGAPTPSQRPPRAAAQANPHAPPALPQPSLPAEPAPVESYDDLCAHGDLHNVEVLKEMTQMIVRPAYEYLMLTVFDKCLPQVERMQAARKFDPLQVISNSVTEADVGSLAEKYRFFSLSRFQTLPDKMKEEIPEYKAAVSEIKPFAERIDKDGKDTFDIETWWRGNEQRLPAWTFALRAVLCHVPNSAPPERAFSILNDSFGDDQTSALADYKEASIMLQYNERGRK